MNWRNYSVFISSTFADMHAERDYLNMFVFPQINKELKKYCITLRIIDLRWGIDTSLSDAQQVEEKVMDVCFDEIDRSRPFFLGLLGNRYGWTPLEECTRLLQNKRLRKNSSITSMEIEYGFLNREDSACVLFMERNASCLRNMDTTNRIQYDDAYSEDERTRTENPKKLKNLKEEIKSRLRERNKEDCYQTYTPVWNGKKFEGLEEFGNKVKQAMLKEIESLFGNVQETQPFQEEQSTQDEFLHLKSAKAYNRSSITDDLINKIEKGKGLLTVSAGSGYGKSYIYALLVNRFKRTPGYITLYHATSAGVGCRELLPMLQRWIYQLETEFKLQHIDIQTRKDAITYFCRLVNRPLEGKKIILFIDALDGFLKTDETEYLSFYPRSTSSMMMCTALPQYIGKISSYHRNMEEYTVPPLEVKEAEAIISRFLSHNSKELYHENIRRLTEKEYNGIPCCSSPLWLSIALGRMICLNERDFSRMAVSGSNDFNRNFIDFVNEEIDNFPGEEAELFRLFLHSLNSFYGEFPARIFKLLSVSYNGLEESTIATLSGKLWNPLNFATVRMFLNDFIAESGEQKSWKIMHDKCKPHLEAEETEEVCREIVQTYLEKLGKGENINDNICHYLILCNDKELVNEYLSAFHRHKERIRQELWDACRSVGQQKVTDFILEAYKYRAKVRRMTPKSLIFWELKEIISTFAKRFNKAGEYQSAYQLIESFYALIEEQQFSKEVKSLIYIITGPEHEEAFEEVLDTEELERVYLEKTRKIKIRGPFTLILAPIARRYYKWKIFKPSTDK